MRYGLVIRALRANLPGEGRCAVGVLDRSIAGMHEFGAEPGRKLAGRVRRTVLRGVDISADVETYGDRHGRLLRRGEA